MGKVWRVHNVSSGEITFFGARPKLRQYLLMHPDDEINKSELDLSYKWQVINLLNETVKQDWSGCE